MFCRKCKTPLQPTDHEARKCPKCGVWTFVEGTCDFAPNTPHEKCDNANWKPPIQTCTRQAPHVCKVDSPCNGWPSSGLLDSEDCYVAFCRYTEKGSIVTCDSDAPKAFKVYRHPTK